jgi:hypothetical protein
MEVASLVRTVETKRDDMIRAAEPRTKLVNKDDIPPASGYELPKDVTWWCDVCACWDTDIVEDRRHTARYGNVTRAMWRHRDHTEVEIDLHVFVYPGYTEAQRNEARRRILEAFDECST